MGQLLHERGGFIQAVSVDEQVAADYFLAFLVRTFGDGWAETFIDRRTRTFVDPVVGAPDVCCVQDPA